MPGAAEWKRRAIYQIITDRYATVGNSRSVEDSSQRKYCGGTWRGIISKLDYIQNLGFDAIWISPVTKNIEEETFYGYGYHGYWPEDIYTVNPHFGTASDLLALSDALHARNMYLMVDVVVNHMGSSSVVDYSRYTPFDSSSYFHPQQLITNYEDQTLVEHGWLGDKHVPLPDLDTENLDVAHTLYAWISSLVKNFRIDGLRIDTVKHVRRDFWPGFVKAAGVWCMGEVLSGDPDHLASYQPYLGGLLDYATYYPLLRAFETGGSMYELTNLLQPSYRQKFRDVQQLATFMENHDMPRFTRGTSSDPSVIRNALVWTMLGDGIPVLYYGQEQSFSGYPDLDAHNDQDGRQPMWESGYKITSLYLYIALLNNLRKLMWNSAIGHHLTTVLQVNANIAVLQRGALLIVLTNHGSWSPSFKLGVHVGFKVATLLVDVLTGQSIMVRPTTNITIIGGQPRIYLPYDLAREVCPNIAPPLISPASRLLSCFDCFSTIKEKSSKLGNRSIGATGTAGENLEAAGIDVSAGRIIRPEPTSLNSEYSIFNVNSRKA